MKRNLIIAVFAVVLMIAGCAPSYTAGLMEIDPVGKDPNLFASAQVRLINDADKTLYFRMLDVVTNVAIGNDIQLDPNQEKTITPNADQVYRYIIFTNNNDKAPVYGCNEAMFRAGYTYSLHFSKALNSKK